MFAKPVLHCFGLDFEGNLRTMGEHEIVKHSQHHEVEELMERLKSDSERVGFEPTERLRAQRFSRPLPKSCNSSNAKDLEKKRKGAYKLVYKKKSEKGRNRAGQPAF